MPDGPCLYNYERYLKDVLLDGVIVGCQISQKQLYAVSQSKQYTCPLFTRCSSLCYVFICQLKLYLHSELHTQNHTHTHTHTYSHTHIYIATSGVYIRHLKHIYDF